MTTQFWKENNSPSGPTVRFAADDFGLTCGITDTILKVVDNGPVRLVSIMANGEAVEYALSEYKKRSERLTLAVHLTLTEGRALSKADDIPLLADAAGNFKYGVAGLWAAYLIAWSKRRLHFREQVRREITAQLARIQEASGIQEIAVNGHQHVHLIPFILDELVALPGIREIRTVREPFQWSWSPTTTIARVILILLSNRAARSMRLHNIATNDSFIGFVYSGHMTEKALQAGLARANGSVEVLSHPGSAQLGELDAWKGSRADIAWHYSPWRAKERGMLVTLRVK